MAFTVDGISYAGLHSDLALQQDFEASIRTEVANTTNEFLQDSGSDARVGEEDVDVVVRASTNTGRRLSGNGVEVETSIAMPSTVADPVASANAMQAVLADSSVSSELISAVQQIPNIHSVTTGAIGVSGLAVSVATPEPTPAPTPVPEAPSAGAAQPAATLLAVAAVVLAAVSAA